MSELVTAQPLPVDYTVAIELLPADEHPLVRMKTAVRRLSLKSATTAAIAQAHETLFQGLNIFGAIEQTQHPYQYRELTHLRALGQSLTRKDIRRYAKNVLKRPMMHTRPYIDLSSHSIQTIDLTEPEAVALHAYYSGLIETHLILEEQSYSGGFSDPTYLLQLALEVDGILPDIDSPSICNKLSSHR